MFGEVLFSSLEIDRKMWNKFLVKFFLPSAQTFSYATDEHVSIPLYIASTLLCTRVVLKNTAKNKQ